MTGPFLFVPAMAHCRYEYEGGREAVLQALTGLFARADFSVLLPRVEALFVPLVMRLQVEPSGRLRLVVGGTLKALLRRLQEHAGHERRSGRNAPLLARLLSFSEAWLGGSGDSRLQRAGAQVSQPEVQSPFRTGTHEYEPCAARMHLSRRIEAAMGIFAGLPCMSGPKETAMDPGSVHALHFRS